MTTTLTPAQDFIRQNLGNVLNACDGVNGDRLYFCTPRGGNDPTVWIVEERDNGELGCVFESTFQRAPWGDSDPNEYTARYVRHRNDPEAEPMTPDEWLKSYGCWTPKA